MTKSKVTPPMDKTGKFMFEQLGLIINEVKLSVYTKLKPPI